MARQTPIVLATTNAASLDMATYNDAETRLVLDSGRLVNTYRRPIRIREIDFTILAQPGDNALAAALTARSWNWGAVIQADLRTAGRVITQGPVPIWLLSQPICGPHVPTLGSIGTGVPFSEARPTLDRTATAYEGRGYGNFYRWLLPQPLDLAPGQGVAGSLLFSRQDYVGEYLSTILTNPVAISTTVSLLGHLTDGAPAPVRPVPYASFHRFSSASALISPQDALGNPFAVPLTVQRLAGRGYLNGSGVPLGDSSVFPLNGFGTRARLRAPRGYYAASDFTPLPQVFSPNRRGWTVNTVLAGPDDYFTLELESAPLSAEEFFHVGLIGSRLERF